MGITEPREKTKNDYEKNEPRIKKFGIRKGDKDNWTVRKRMH